MIVLTLTCVGLNLISFNLVALGVTAGMWFIAYPILVWAGRTDPNMIGIYFRNIKYPKHIPAFTTPFRKTAGYVAPKEHKIWNR